MKERQAWCNLQLKLSSMPERFVSLAYENGAIEIVFLSFPFMPFRFETRAIKMIVLITLIAAINF